MLKKEKYNANENYFYLKVANMKFLLDLKHLLWLIKQMLVLGFKGDWAGSYESWLLLKIHWNYRGKIIKTGKEEE